MTKEQIKAEGMKCPHCGKFTIQLMRSHRRKGQAHLHMVPM